MSYAVNSIVGSISGTVAYQDGSNSSFNAEMNYDGTNTLDFTANAKESRDTLNRIVNTTSEGTTAYRDGFTYLMRYTSTLLSNNFNWGAHASAAADDGKKIIDVVYHLNVNIAFNDGTTYPVSATYQKVGGSLSWENYFVVAADLAKANHFTGQGVPGAANPTNKTAMLTKIDDMFKQIVAITVPSA
jgi:hypothetical protein